MSASLAEGLWIIAHEKTAVFIQLICQMRIENR